MEYISEERTSGYVFVDIFLLLVTNYIHQQIKMLAKFQTVSIRDLYRDVRNQADNGIEGYHLVKKYEDPAAAIKSRQQSKHKKKVRELKRGSYLQDQIYAKKDIPGVCSYNILPKQVPKEFKKKQITKQSCFGQTIRIAKKNNIPSAAHYQLEEQVGSKQSGSKFGPILRKGIDRENISKMNYLDTAEYEGASLPGVGQYQISKIKRTKTENAVLYNKKPQFWREMHKQGQKQEKEKIEKLGPGVGAYNPLPLQYQLFEQKKKIDRAVSQAKLDRIKSISSKQKLKTLNSDIGPGKYNIINQWRGAKKKNKKGILQMISKGPAPSIYYH